MSYNYLTQYDSPNYTPAAQAPAVFGMARIIEGITIHWWGDPAQNPQFNSIVSYLCRPNGNTSAHFVATGTGRQVACIVAPGDVAWHSGSAWGNARTIGIELDPRARDEDYDVAAELIADIRSAYGDVPIYWHSYFVATTCPGVWDPVRLDQLSYTKYSHATDWGKGGDINPKAPTPPPAPVPEPEKVLYKVIGADGKQVGAYSTDANAFRGYNEHNATKIMLGAKNVTAEVLAKFTTPSPTTQNPDGTTQPDSGAPITDKIDYSEQTYTLVQKIFLIVQEILNKLTGVFK